jgi:serine/threonine-protein kinase RsbW
VQLTITLCLPRDELTVPVARHIVRGSLAQVGVVDGAVDDIELALSEACTNVLKHSGPGDAYDVSVSLENERASIRVVDTGHGFDWQSLGDEVAPPSAERGRGIELMRALVDRVKFESVPETGTVCHLEKTLELEPDSVLKTLS